MKIDVWFARYDDHLWMAIAPHGEEPPNPAVRVSSATKALQRVRWTKDMELEQVGICYPEMLGLE
jgi:hypothetical protein